MILKQVLKDLSNSFGIGTNYNSIHSTIKKYIDNKNIEVDINNNLIYTLSEKDNAKNKILIDAHIDEIGFIVTYINEDGFIKISSIGGVDARLLLGRKVLILGEKNITGVISCKAPHIKNSNEVQEIDELVVDTGYNKKDLLDIVAVGDFCVFKKETKELINNRITGKSLDNRVGASILIDCINKLNKEKFNDCEIKFLFSTKEECSNGVGAKTFVDRFNPTEVIVLDVSFAYQNNTPRNKCGIMNNGPMIAFSPILSLELSNNLEEIAKNNKICFQKEILPSSTGTNADYIATALNGIKTSVISVPIKNMHSPVEMVDMSDIEETSRLLEEYLRRFLNV